MSVEVRDPRFRDVVGGEAELRRVATGFMFTRPQVLHVVFSLVNVPALFARGLIKVYRYTLSSLVGRTCRHLPTCSEYADIAIGRFGLWRGGWMALARFSRCRPRGTHGFDPVPEILPAQARWYRPWRYGYWGSVLTD